MTPEYRTLWRNTSAINDAIASKSNPSFFAAKLVDNDIISMQAANNIVQVPTFSDYSKVSKLMLAVDAQIRTASNPVTTFETFIRILRELSLDQLPDKLVEYYSKCFGHHLACTVGSHLSKLQLSNLHLSEPLKCRYFAVH